MLPPAMTHYPYTLLVEKLRLPVRIGMTEAERIKPRAVDVCLRFHFTTPPAGCADESGAFVCYGLVAEAIRKVAAAQEYKLIEFLTMQIYHAVRADMQAQWGAAADAVKLWLRVQKVETPLADICGGASFVYSDLPADAVVR